MRVDDLFPAFGAMLTPSGAGDDLARVDAERVKALLTERGAVLLRGFRAPRPLFEAFTGRFTHRFLVHGAGVRQRLEEGGMTQTVTGGTMALRLHRELHFAPFSPDLLCFYCGRAPAEGGETTLGDGVGFLARLSAGCRQLLERQRLRYHNVWARESVPAYFPGASQEQVRARLPELGMKGDFTADGSLEFEYLAPALGPSLGGTLAFANSIDVHRQYLAGFGSAPKDHDPICRHGIALEDGSAVPEAVFDEIEALGVELAQPHRWQTGDILMVDNTRVMHGRRAIKVPEEREVYLRMAHWP